MKQEKRRETVAEFINRVFDGESATYIEFTIRADDALPIRGSKENVLKRLESHELYIGSFQIIDYNHVYIDAIYTPCL